MPTRTIKLKDSKKLEQEANYNIKQQKDDIFTKENYLKTRLNPLLSGEK